ncbi:MAG: AAA family ATPase [Geodermatophilaceae bacterium]|nr:AAA family ATPase [Geodermatophilaceae bacterium]
MLVVRPYQPADLGQVLDLWERTGSFPTGADGLTVDQAVDLIGCEQSMPMLAETDGRVVGMALGLVAGVVGWVYRLVMLPAEASVPETSQRLLDDLESQFTERGVRKIVTVVSGAGPIRELLDRRGYRTSRGGVYLERDLAFAVVARSTLAELGGRMIDPRLWEELRGMDQAKEIIERRVILPLAQPELATRHAVAAPRAVVLFGPPGTGKTTFAKGIASRLGWPSIEIQPAELAGEGPERQAKCLAETFDRILELRSAVVFVDEVEDLASIRGEDRKVTPSVANEFLKQIPRFREVPHHLLVCATNWIRRLDPAFLRPGRFDYVLPVGPPDAEARRAIWQRYIDEITDQAADVGALVEVSEFFTPADIEFAAHMAAQRAFERELLEGGTTRATTADFLWAIQRTRPTLTKEIVESLHEDTLRFARY